jgi:hypothetical protein
MFNKFTLPTQPEIPHVPAPMVYVQQTSTWEYKQITRDLSSEQTPTVEELNALGKDGWELAGVVTNQSIAHFYFKRLR